MRSPDGTFTTRDKTFLFGNAAMAGMRLNQITYFLAVARS
jgi:hypothetical protein